MLYAQVIIDDDTGELLIFGNPLYSGYPEEESLHNCDDMRCSSISHVLISTTVDLQTFMNVYQKG